MSYPNSHQRFKKPKILNRILLSNAPRAVILIRLMVGAVFLSEGIQKFLFPDDLGVGRFIKIGIPSPEILAPFVGIVEIGCGSLIVLGLLTRLAAIPLIINMTVAIYSTKLPILMKEGFWKMAHEARTDWSMLLGSIFLLIVGAGPWAMDAWLARRNQ
jgi:putative oxidoreductase